MSGQKINSRNKKYVPHVASMLHVCEQNYGRLLKLLPDCDTVDMSYQFSISESLSYMLRITECSPYTTTIEMSQSSNGGPGYLRPLVLLRIYHDAKVAEVLSSQNIGNIQPSYGYPNINMYQKNEKAMVNLFLGEWLQFCLQNRQLLSESKA